MPLPRRVAPALALNPDAAHDVFRTKRFRSQPMPDETDRRGWRLGDEASLASWLLSYGYAV